MSVRAFYKDPPGPYSSLLQQRDIGHPVSKESLESAAKDVLKDGITKPFIYNVRSKDSQRLLGHLVGTTHYCNLAMIQNPALEDVASRCSLFFMEHLPHWYEKAEVASLKGRISTCPSSENLAAKLGLGVMMDSTLCIRARSLNVECRGLDSIEESRIRGQFLSKKPLFALDQSGNEYRLGSEGKQNAPFQLPKGSIAQFDLRSDEETLVEMLEFYQSGSSSQLFNFMMIGMGDLDEAIFKANRVWAERSIIPALHSVKDGELPICVVVGVNHLFSLPSAADQTGLIKILRDHGFDVKKA
jgi:hypothetical protein